MQPDGEGPLRTMCLCERSGAARRRIVIIVFVEMVDDKEADEEAKQLVLSRPT